MEVANTFKSHNLLNEVLDKVLKTEIYLRDLRIGTGAKWSLNDDQNVCDVTALRYFLLCQLTSFTEGLIIAGQTSNF